VVFNRNLTEFTHILWIRTWRHAVLSMAESCRIIATLPVRRLTVTSRGLRREDLPATSQDPRCPRDPVAANPGAPVRAIFGQLGSQAATHLEQQNGEQVQTARGVLEPAAAGALR
jgi:hypothetical protein